MIFAHHPHEDGEEKSASLLATDLISSKMALIKGEIQ